MKKFIALSVLFITMFFPVHSAIINIPDDQPSIQSGIDVAVNGDTVLVSDGTYYENLNMHGKLITLASHLLINGDNSHIDNTIIDGSQAENPDNASVISLVSGENSSTIIYGFTIKNGKGTFPDINGLRSGGGIYCIESGASLYSNKFVNNQLSTDSDVYGGAIFMYNSEMNLRYCHFDNNNASRGGAIYSQNSNLSFNFCDFSNNEATDQGAGMYFANNNNSTTDQILMVSNCSFYGNLCNETTAGLLVRNDATNGNLVTFEMHNSNFMDNVSAQRTALHIMGENLEYQVYNSVFAYNDADNYVAGVSISKSSIGGFYNCIFHSNNADLLGNGFNSGGASVWSNAEAGFINCVFADNTASFGAGLTVGGGGISKTVNTIFWNNSPDQISLTSYDNQGGTLDISYCDIQGGVTQIDISEESELIEGEGNFDTDPDFLMDNENPYSITEGSACIDAGTSEGGLELPEGDIIGNVRIWDGNGDGTPIVDIGAYEFDAGPMPSVNEHLQSGSTIIVYPNPASNYITFKMTENGFIDQIEIIDINGRIIEQIVTNNKTEKYFYNTSGLKKGIYFCRITSEVKLTTTRFVIQ